MSSIFNDSHSKTKSLSYFATKFSTEESHEKINNNSKNLKIFLEAPHQFSNKTIEYYKIKLKLNNFTAEEVFNEFFL